MEWKNIFAVFALLLLFAGCIGSGQIFPKGGEVAEAMVSGARAPSSGAGVLPRNNFADEQMVIQTGSLSLKVPEGTLEEKAAAVRGFVSEVRGAYSGIFYYETDVDKYYYLTVKVPPSRFDEFVSKLRTIGEIKSINTNLEDVTEQYTDINTRISNLDAELARLNELYDKAENVEDVLAIEREVTRVQTELDLYKQQKLDLERRSAMSTISVRVYEEKPALQASLLVPLERLLAVFFGALSFGIMLLAGGIGFFLPVAIAMLVLWKVWKFFRGKKK